LNTLLFGVRNRSVPLLVKLWERSFEPLAVITCLVDT
jgi:hypothetical protein